MILLNLPGAYLPAGTLEVAAPVGGGGGGDETTVLSTKVWILKKSRPRAIQKARRRR
jgi:hypothetical protein